MLVILRGQTNYSRLAIKSLEVIPMVLLEARSSF